ncbi:hypothetical protein [Streptomyces sp. NPDC006477]|uniref:hypothetical protein n=1 Tax=Streptomyces sp. NPDC006477 TaxID=3364747 RepID=UPI00369804B2
MAHIPYPNRERTLRHLRRVFPRRDRKAMHYTGRAQWCCEDAFVTLGKAHTVTCRSAWPDA